MSHDHSHADDSSYFAEQLCTIGICGLLGGVAYLMGSQGATKLFFLHSMFHVAVLLGGITLVLLVAVRAVAVWRLAGQTAATHPHDHDCGEPHPHDHDCGAHHAHEHACDHEHEHSHAPMGHDGHDHGWNPWRYAVLLLPIVLYFLNLPNQGFSAVWLQARGNAADLDPASVGFFSADLGIQFAADTSSDAFPRVERVNSETPAQKKGILPGDLLTQIRRDVDSDGKQLPAPEVIATKGLSLEEVIAKLQGKPGTTVRLTFQRNDMPLDVELVRDQVFTLHFKELEEAKFSPESRDWYTGRKGRIKGQYSPSGKDRIFSLMRLKMTCCAADVVPLNVVIEAPEKVADLKTGDWIEVEGSIQFLLDPARKTFVPYMKIASLDKIQKIPPEPDMFLQW